MKLSPKLYAENIIITASAKVMNEELYKELLYVIIRKI